MTTQLYAIKMKDGKLYMDGRDDTPFIFHDELAAGFVIKHRSTIQPSKFQGATVVALAPLMPAEQFAEFVRAADAMAKWVRLSCNTLDIPEAMKLAAINILEAYNEQLRAAREGVKLP